MIAAARSLLSDMRIVFAGGRRRVQWLAVLVAAATALDLLGVALVGPLLAVAVGQQASVAEAFRDILPASLPALASMVLGVYAARAALALIVQHRISMITEGERARLMGRLLGAFQSMPWERHLLRSSPDLVNRVVWYTQASCAGVLSSLLRLVADGLVFIALTVMLFASDPMATIVLGAIIACVGVLAIGMLRPGTAAALRGTADGNARVMEATQHAMGALREVRLLGREAAFRDRLATAAALLARSGAAHAVHAQAPRHLLELALVAFVVVMLISGHGQDDSAGALPMLATFAAAGLRLLPAGTSLVANANAVLGHRFALRELAAELREIGTAPSAEEDVLKRNPQSGAPFREITLRGAWYAYPGASTPVLQGVDLVIRSGECVGLVGPSGAGKSTLADVMLGLLVPQRGDLLVDGQPVAVDPLRWQRRCAYIPQSVYLLDDTIRRNIALGEPDGVIDEQRLWHAIDAAQLRELVSNLPMGLDARVGERGVRLSGGQRQRLAVARALYHRREFLVLDEATSALDQETEAAVVGAIAALAGQVTMLIIAHRESTLAGCDRVLRVVGGRVLDETSSPA
jgi:ABC-type multidrug transport system fused ATPase/permease subunit